ncbi:MAG: hypothetical protein Q8K75_07910 [Chlamydiales bacterium]|nr:hypothetical protein [Chlamydiales bacterium]
MQGVFKPFYSPLINKIFTPPITKAPVARPIVFARHFHQKPPYFHSKQTLEHTLATHLGAAIKPLLSFDITLNNRPITVVGNPGHLTGPLLIGASRNEFAVMLQDFAPGNERVFFEKEGIKDTKLILGIGDPLLRPLETYAANALYFANGLGRIESCHRFFFDLATHPAVQEAWSWAKEGTLDPAFVQAIDDYAGKVKQGPLIEQLREFPDALHDYSLEEWETIFRSVALGLVKNPKIPEEVFSVVARAIANPMDEEAQNRFVHEFMNRHQTLNMLKMAHKRLPEVPEDKAIVAVTAQMQLNYLRQTLEGKGPKQ